MKQSDLCPYLENGREVLIWRGRLEYRREFAIEKRIYDIPLLAHRHQNSLLMAYKPIPFASQRQGQ